MEAHPKSFSMDHTLAFNAHGISSKSVASFDLRVLKRTFISAVDGLYAAINTFKEVAGCARVICFVR